MSDTVRALNDALDAWQRGALDAAALSATWRRAAAAWPGLPARYGQVLEHLLRPLESSGLFTEESCAYSPGDLAEQLRAWLQHAVEHSPPGRAARLNGPSPLTPPFAGVRKPDVQSP